MNLTRIVLTSIALVVASTASFAAPIYTGDTTSSGLSNRDIDTGYYIWNDSSDLNDWSVRWSSTNAVRGNRVHWYGSIIVNGGLESASEYRFERNDRDLFSITTPDYGFLGWKTITNDRGGIDGIDFTVDSNVKSLSFILGSSLFRGLDQEQGSSASYIYLGDNFVSPDVHVSDTRYGAFQSFDVAVSVTEPGTIALLSLGLLGLCFARRTQAQS